MRTFFSKATEDGHGRLLSCFHNLLLFHWEIWQIAGLIVCRNTQAQSRHICRGLASASSTTEQSQLCLNKFGLIRKALPASLTPWEICQPVSRTDIRGIQRTVNSKRLMCACNARQCSDSSEDHRHFTYEHFPPRSSAGKIWKKMDPGTYSFTMEITVRKETLTSIDRSHN